LIESINESKQLIYEAWSKEIPVSSINFTLPNRTKWSEVKLAIFMGLLYV
jgi:hypothetical protein